MGAGSGSLDFDTCAVKMLALHRQCEVSVTVESFVGVIVVGDEDENSIHRAIYNPPYRYMHALRVLGAQE